jgi:uncharacterized membrane protein YkoI
MKTMTTLGLALVVALGVAAPAAAQQPATQRPTYEREVPAALVPQAKISEDSSLALALARVPHGVPDAVELVRHSGTLEWVWDIKVAGKRGITEVTVNATNGAVTSHDE